MFRREAIIIAANSGARISEIRRFEYGSCFYSEDEGLYKIILEDVDKVNQQNRPIYLTKDGYNAVKRVEELKKKYDTLKPSWNERAGKNFVHLFTYRGSNVLSEESLHQFLNRIKRKIGLVDEYGEVVKGGMHAFRHFFAMIVFVESGYNISVVRYLVGHKTYNMSFQYLEEEKDRILNMVRNRENNTHFSGPALNTLIDILLSNSKNNDLKIIFERSEKLSDLINQKQIKKVAFGYCLKPCENAQRCIRCRNFLLSKQDEDEIVQAATELFELLCYKIYLFKSTEEALKDINIQNDIADLITLLEEIRILGIENKITGDLQKVVKAYGN